MIPPGKTPFIVLVALIFIAGIFTGVIIDRKFPPKANAAVLEKGKSGLQAPTQTTTPNPSDTISDPSGNQKDDDSGDAAKTTRKAEQIKKTFIKRMSKQLSLTADQQKKLSDIVTQNEPGFLSIRSRFKTDFAQLHTQVVTQITDILDDKQKKEFKKNNSLLWRFMTTGKVKSAAKDNKDSAGK